MLEGKPVKGILGTTLPPNKNQIVKTIDQIKVDDYKILVLPGGVKAMEKVSQEKKIIKFITKFNDYFYFCKNISTKVNLFCKKESL